MSTTTTSAVTLARDEVERMHRPTRGQRSLWYQLRVLQQPERARACGSGMKANSDRRPVDPPPVVELRIIEGTSLEEGKDITFDYNANFFLYASLEQARPLAHGRVQNSAALNPPILTGVPASGMAYLDRPSEAGYFIFPDLSVRHEGYFRLPFSLFETTKEERDFDIKPVDENLPPGVDWRMEIKTRPFNVYSAKKFPGLMESTPLSKTVADQGCRVRIRRDVRMRKRDTKGNGYERREEDFHRRTATPGSDDRHSMRGRSLSTSSEQPAPSGGDPQRRPSVNDNYLIHRKPSLPPIAPTAPSSAEPATPSASNHLWFGGAAQRPQYSPRHPQPPSARPVALGLALPPPTPTAYAPSRPLSPYIRPDLSSPHNGRSTCSSPLPSNQPVMYERTIGRSDPKYAILPARSASDAGQNNGHLYPTSTMPPLRMIDGGIERQFNGIKQEREPGLEPRDCRYPDMEPEFAPRTSSRASSLTSLKIASLVSPLSTRLPVIEAKPEAEAEPEAMAIGGKRKAQEFFPGPKVRMSRISQRLELKAASIETIAADPQHEPYPRADGGDKDCASFSCWK